MKYFWQKTAVNLHFGLVKI